MPGFGPLGSSALGSSGPATESIEIVHLADALAMGGALDAFSTLPLTTGLSFGAGLAGQITVVLGDDLAFEVSASELQTMLLRAHLALEATGAMRYEGTRTLRDTLVLEAQFAGIYHELLSVSLALGAPATAGTPDREVHASDVLATLGR